MNTKIYTGDIQPNAKEYKIWIDSKGSIKTYDTTQGTWSEVRGGASNTQPTPAENITFTWKKAITEGGMGGSDLSITGYEDLTFTVKEGTRVGEFIYSDQADGYGAMCAGADDSGSQEIYVAHSDDMGFGNLFTSYTKMADENGWPIFALDIIQDGAIYKEVIL